MGLQIALIRGINVGRAKRVAMKDLRDLIEKLGGKDVRTILNSGNAVFIAPPAGIAAERLEAEMSKQIGVSGRVTMLSEGEFSAIVRENPLKGVASDPARHLVAFLGDHRERGKLEPLARQQWSPEVLAVGRRAAYLWCPGGISSGRLAEAVGKALGEGVTMRNMATVMKVHATIRAQREIRT